MTFTLNRKALTSARNPYRVWLLLTYKNSDFGVISVYERSRSHLESGTSLNIGEVRRQFLSADLHRSKPVILLVPFNLHFHCFQG